MECWIYSNFWSKSVALRQKGHVTYFRNKKVRVNRKCFLHSTSIIRFSNHVLQENWISNNNIRCMMHCPRTIIQFYFITLHSTCHLFNFSLLLYLFHWRTSFPSHILLFMFSFRLLINAWKLWTQRTQSYIINVY